MKKSLRRFFRDEKSLVSLHGGFSQEKNVRRVSTKVFRRKKIFVECLRRFFRGEKSLVSLHGGFSQEKNVRGVSPEVSRGEKCRLGLFFLFLA
jgi:ribosomal protein L32E